MTFLEMSNTDVKFMATDSAPGRNLVAVDFLLGPNRGYLAQAEFRGSDQVGISIRLPDFTRH